MARVFLSSTRNTAKWAIQPRFGILLAAFALLTVRASAQLPPLPPPPPEIEYEEPPEEDVSYADQEYFFNPLQAKKEMDAGNFYYKKGNYQAAKNRYLEATRWDEFSPEPFWKLGETCEKLEDYAGAREAWGKFVELSKDKGKVKDVQEKFSEWAKNGY